MSLGSFSTLIALGGILSLAGCGQDGSLSSQDLLAPGASGIRGMAEPNTARIALPFDPSNFVSTVDNPYFPLTPGTVYSYVEETPEGLETNEVAVTHDTKVILGVTTTIVWDRVYLNGSLKEDTFDWYAQDNAGNVWYFGEDTKTVENGVVVSTAGSWEAGKDGAKAGIIMLSSPRIGNTYYQEFAPGVVEDQGRVLSLKESVSVPYGEFEDCLKTADWTPIEPGNRAFKYYARGIGMVLEIIPRDGRARVELTAVTQP